eukprot:1069488-Alexandrium_andersonii.AAC.1
MKSTGQLPMVLASTRELRETMGSFRLHRNVQEKHGELGEHGEPLGAPARPGEPHGGRESAGEDRHVQESSGCPRQPCSA